MMGDDKIEFALIGIMALVVLGGLFIVNSEATRKNTRFESCVKNHSVAECTPLLKD